MSVFGELDNCSHFFTHPRDLCDVLEQEENMPSTFTHAHLRHWCWVLLYELL